MTHGLATKADENYIAVQLLAVRKQTFQSLEMQGGADRLHGAWRKVGQD